MWLFIVPASTTGTTKSPKNLIEKKRISSTSGQEDDVDGLSLQFAALDPIFNVFLVPLGVCVCVCIVRHILCVCVCVFLAYFLIKLN